MAAIQTTEEHMNPSDQTETSRRQFVTYLAWSPLLFSPGALAAFLQESTANGRSANSDPEYQELGARLQELIASPDEAINVFDFEPVARAGLPPAHYGYLATGVEDDATLRENREAFSRLYLRPRRLMDVSAVDMSTDLFGTSWSSPIVLAPAGSQKAFHPDGEIAAAKAAKNQ
ncbi:MAG: hypothetical protein GTO63_24860, partial [Anaerolineae bacterium]|nr:hypothetical protein [Anaerolineae bacterium]NIQ80925.1 hypothetical protein [Anaerolineae bacterium]